MSALYFDIIPLFGVGLTINCGPLTFGWIAQSWIGRRMLYVFCNVLLLCAPFSILAGPCACARVWRRTV